MTIQSVVTKVKWDNIWKVLRTVPDNNKHYALCPRYYYFLYFIVKMVTVGILSHNLEKQTTSNPNFAGESIF